MALEASEDGVELKDFLLNFKQVGKAKLSHDELYRWRYVGLLKDYGAVVPT